LLRVPNLIVQLEFADASFVGHGPEGSVLIGVERKTVTDLLSSIASGRLIAHQLPGMMDMYDVVYLVVEGIAKEDKTDGRLLVSKDGGKSFRDVSYSKRLWTMENIAHFLISREQEGIRVRMTNSIRMTAHTVEHLHSWWAKEWHKHKSHLALHKHRLQGPVSFDMSRRERPSLVRKIAAELPSVGIDRSQDVAKRFKSVREMFEASIDDWNEIEGFGKVTSKHAWEALHK
jgi:ERCC4-type nuclease